MKKFYTLFILAVSFYSAAAQQLMYEPFNYPPDPVNGLHLQSGGVWTRINTGDSILVESGSLNYAGLESSSGNRVKFDGTGSENYYVFAPQTTGTVYGSFLLNITSLGALGTSGGYFATFIQPASTSAFGGAVWARAGTTAGTYNIGISTRSNSTVSWLADELLPGTTHFIVMAYEMVAGTSNDFAMIWLNPVPGSAEPAADGTAVAATTDLSGVERFLLRQDNATNTPFIEIDEIRAGTTWTSVTPSASIPDPTTTSIVPSSATAGGSGFTLTVYGTGFISGQSTVTWNGTDRPTTFVSSTELTATISPADIAAPGTAQVGVTTVGATSPSNTQTFTINASPTPVLSASPLSGFGNVCINTTAGPNSFTLTGSDLTAADVVIGPLSGFSFSTSSSGTYTTTLTLAQPGGSLNQDIFVQFTPASVQIYDGMIPVSGGGATAISIAVTGEGINTMPTVTTGTATAITSSMATLSGVISSDGCSVVAAYGVEYSTINNFTPGTGVQVPSTNLSAGSFSVDVPGLTPNTTHYFRAYATNNGGTAYGAQQSFTTQQVPPPSAPVALAATNITSSSFTANWNAVTGATGYFLDVYTLGTGALVDTIAGWNFLTNTAAAQTADEGNANNIGIQTVSGSGLGTISWPGGPTSTTGTNPYSVSANGWDNGANTKYWIIDVNTTGASDITISSMQGSSGTGPGEFKLQYRVGAAGIWTDIPGGNITLTTAVSPGNPATWASVTDLPLPADADNQPLVSIRWISTSNTSVNLGTVGSTGTSRISAIYVKGSTGTGTVPVYVPGYQDLSVGDVTSYDVSGLTPGNIYYYVVRANNPGGTSPSSNEISVSTGSGPAPVLTAGSVNDFGTITVGNNSFSQSFDISGSDLTGAPGLITITSPSAHFQVSNDNSNWGSSTSIPYNSATLPATTVFVRFTPQAPGVQSGNITITGGGVGSPVTVAVSGSGVPVAPPVAPVATPATSIVSTGFTANWNAVANATGYYLDVYTLATGSIMDTIAGWNFLTNTAAAQTADEGNANNIGIQTVSGAGLGTISWPGGPTSTTGTNPYSVSANGWDNGANTKYWVIDVNTTGASGISVSSLQGSSGTGPREFQIQYRVGASGTWTDVPGGNVEITAAVSPNNLATWFGVTDLALPADADNQPLVSIRWLSVSNTSVNMGTVGSAGTSRVSAIYVKALTGSGTTIVYVPGLQNLSVGNVTSYNVTGLSPNTTYYYVVRAENAGGNSPNSNEITVVTAPDISPVLHATAPAAFGDICAGAAGPVNSFTLTGSNLTAADIVIGPLEGYAFSAFSAGPFTPTLIISQPGGSFNQEIYVQFLPLAAQDYNGNIPVSGAGATPVNIPVTGSSTSTAPAVISGEAGSITSVSAVVSGTVADQGCSAITGYGIEYSGISGFTPGSGTKVPGNNLSGSNYSVNLGGLVPGATYYYRAYASNADATGYGEQRSFTLSQVPDGFMVYPVPLARGSQLNFSRNNLRQGHVGVVLYNSIGQEVYRKNFNIQATFINDHIIIPQSLAPGIYRVQIINGADALEVKTVLVL